MYYLLLMGVFLPLLVVRSHFKLEAGAACPPKQKLFVRTLYMEAFFLAFALAAAWQERIWIFPKQMPELRHLGFGGLVLVLLVGAMLPHWKHRVTHERERALRSRPEKPAELKLWFFVSLAAGTVEEVAYRGVMFTLLARVLPGWWIPVLLCALAFGLGHFTHGWKHALIIFVLAIVLHALVRLTGTLYIAMGVHFLYDMIGGIAYCYLAQRTAPSSVPQTA